MKTELSILLICKSLPWRFKGGIQTHTWDLARALQAKGNSVTILTGGSFFGKLETYQKEEVSIVELPYFPGRYLPLVSFLAEEYAFNFQVKSWVKSSHSNFDIIHAQGRSGYLLFQMPELHKKLFQTIHGNTKLESLAETKSAWNTRIHRFFAQKWEQKLLSVSHGAIAVSEDLKGNIGSTNGISKIKVIPNGVSSFSNQTRIRPLKLVDKFVFVGRLHPIKGLIPLIKEIGKSERKIHLDIIGEGPQRQELEELIEANGLKNQVRLLGAYDNSCIHYLLPYYKGLILPSSYESQGIVLLEANLQGLPVIASDLPSIRESITQGYNGILCDQKRPGTFIEAFFQILDQPLEAKKMGENGLNRVLNEYSWPNIAEQTLNYYRIAS